MLTHLEIRQIFCPFSRLLECLEIVIKKIFVAAGTDGANAFITPEMLASLSAAGLSPSLGIPCASTLTDSMFNLIVMNYNDLY